MARSSERDEYRFQLMRIQARPGSKAEQAYYRDFGLPGRKWPMLKAIAPGVSPAPLDELIFHGGKLVPKMEFQNVYLGGEVSWKESDVTAIDMTIDLAMRDRRLNNVLSQYFHNVAIDCSMREPFMLDEAKPASLSEPDVQDKVMSLYDSNLIEKPALDSCIFNLLLPPGTVLKLDNATSLTGLGGYHGSMHIQRNGKRITLCYSANVHSNTGANGRGNAIVVFYLKPDSSVSRQAAALLFRSAWQNVERVLIAKAPPLNRAY